MCKQLRTPIAVLAFVAFSGAASNASAELLAGLQVDIGPGVAANVRGEVSASIGKALSRVSYWEWVEPGTARAQMNPIVRDCFTTECLEKVGESTGADAGLRVRFTGEAEIYDWSLEIYDLSTGEQLHSAKGACELCGRVEVVREFESSVTALATSTRLPRRPTASSSNDQPPKAEADAEPPKSVEPVAEPPRTTDPVDDPLGELSVIDISVVPEDTIVFLDGEEIGRGPTSISLGPGAHEFRYAREGHRGFKDTIVVDPSSAQRLFVRVHLSQTDPMPVEVTTEGPVDRLGKQRRTYGIIGLVAGGTLLGTGIYLNYLDGRPACSDGTYTECPRLYETSTGSFITTFAGAALLTTGSALLAWELLAGGEERAPKTARLMPSVSDDHAGVVLFGRF